MSSPSNFAFRSPVLRKMMKGTRKAKRSNNNLYRPSNTEVPELNLSYVENRNESVRNAFNNVIVGARSTVPLTNKQKEARIAVARKMARGEPVGLLEKINAGMSVILPKPLGPKPVRPSKGGKKTRKSSKRRRMTRRR
jgi:hypothetical protein